jgi:hypothetical protein
MRALSRRTWPVLRSSSSGSDRDIVSTGPSTSGSTSTPAAGSANGRPIRSKSALKRALARAPNCVR